jgi:hypothetical protein
MKKSGGRFAMVVALAVVMGCWVGRAEAGTLYGLSSSTPGSVYTLNQATGAATLVTNLNSLTSGFTSLVGLEARNGTLFATDVSDPDPGEENVFRFGTIDLTTGVFMARNNQGESVNWQSLAYVPSSDLFYTVDLNNILEPLLLSVMAPPAPAIITPIGPTDQLIRGLAYDNNNSVLYGVDDDELYTINTSTGAATLVGPTGLNSFRQGLAYDTENDVLYLNLGDGPGGDSLYRLNTTTGLATLVGPNGPTEGDGIDGLAFIPSPAQGVVPEPGSLALLGLGALGLAGSAYRRRKQTV